MNNDDRKIVWVIVCVSILGLLIVSVSVALFVHAITTRRFSYQGASASSFQGQVVIPTEKTAFCDANLREERLRFFRRTSVEAYRKVGRRNPAWDAAALHYLDACCRNSAGMPDARTAESLAPEGKALVDAGCTDPLVEYNYGLELIKNDRKAEAKRYLLRAIDGFNTCHYPCARARFAPTRLAEIDHGVMPTTFPSPQGKLAKEQFTAKMQALQWIGKSLRDGSFTSSEQRLFFDQLDDQLDEVFTASDVVANMRSTPGVDPYIREVFEGRKEIDDAWTARGNACALDVTPEEWKGFYRHLALARQQLTAAWKQHPDFPEAPSNMIQVAMVGAANPGETVYTWFNRAVHAQMDYEPAYYYLLFALRPCWGFSYEEKYHVGLACLATKRFDTIVPSKFFNAVWMISDQTDGDLVYWHRPETYQHLQTMFAGYLKAAPAQRNQCNSWYAASAYLCGHYADAQRLLDALGSQAEEEPFRQYANCSLAAARVRISMCQPPDLREQVSAPPIVLRMPPPGLSVSRDEARRIIMQQTARQLILQRAARRLGTPTPARPFGTPIPRPSGTPIPAPPFGTPIPRPSRTPIPAPPFGTPIPRPSGTPIPAPPFGTPTPQPSGPR